MMKKYLLAILALGASTLGANAQNFYALNNKWVDLDNLKLIDSAELPQPDTLALPVMSGEGADATMAASAAPPEDTVIIPAWDFKRTSKYAPRFRVFSLTGAVPKEAEYMKRPFRIVDESKLAYKVTKASKEVGIKTNTEENKIDDVPGNQFLLTLPDGILLVQRFDAATGYKVTKYNEWGKPIFKQTVPHTVSIEKAGEEFAIPYLFYFCHTDRFMAFTSLASKDVHKSVIMDLKDGKTLPIGATVCGVVRAPNEIQFMGYLIRDEAAKTIKVNHAGASWTMRDNNITKVVGEVLLADDTTMVVARYYKGMAGINLAAFHAKTGRLIWAANKEMIQPKESPEVLYLSMNKKQLLLEGSNKNGNYLEMFDVATGKRLYSTLEP